MTHRWPLVLAGVAAAAFALTTAALAYYGHLLEAVEHLHEDLGE